MNQKLHAGSLLHQNSMIKLMKTHRDNPVMLDAQTTKHSQLTPQQQLIAAEQESTLLT